MAKVKIINNNLDSNLNGDAFLNTASQTIFSFGRFSITSNFDGRTLIDYTNELSTFTKPITLENLNITETESKVSFNKSNNAVLNLDNTNLNTFVKFGSSYEFLRVSIQNIIVDYPGSLFVDSQINAGGNNTFLDFEYDENRNISKFRIPSIFVVNKFGLVYDRGNDNIPDNNKLKNLNLSFHNYVVWSSNASSDNSHTIIGFTGDTNGDLNVYVECMGNPFPFIGEDDYGRFDIHLKPNTIIFEDFRSNLSDFEKYLVSERNGTDGFEFKLNEPILLDDGRIKYSNKNILWVTGDGYNIDFDTPTYRNFLDRVLTIGNKYDQIKSDLVARFLTPASIKTYDLTEEGKITKLLRIYGQEFDQIKQFIDSLVHINKLTYDKKNNLPDQIISNLARTLGWDHFQLVNEEELVDKIFGFDLEERNLNTDPTPAEVDIELWRRILMNTNYLWKTKGTRDAIKSIFLMIGIPEPFINITEYVYTVDGRIDPREVPLTLTDLPSASLPYNSEGYPIAPTETPNFYFQMSGNSDSGQAYMNNFRNVGFSLLMQVDNKKSWVQDEGTYRTHHSSPTYYQEDSKLVLNTKEVDISLDTARGIEYDVYKYVKEIDFPKNSTGYTLPYTYVNLSLGLDNPNEFELPDTPDPEGDVEVRFNGILLTGPKIYSGGTMITDTGNTDYYFTSPKTFVIPALTSYNLKLDGPTRDVVEVTYVYSGHTSNPITGLTVSYVVSRVIPQSPYTKIILPEEPSGDVQLTINGIAATKGTSLLQGDYILNPNNSQEIVIQNPDLISYFGNNVEKYTQVAFITVTGSSDIYARNEVIRVDSLSGGKVYYNSSANKTVLTLNYKILDTKNVKILVDGIALEPNGDYTVNPDNPYQIYLPPSINYGNIISVYYIVGKTVAFDPVVADEFGLGDITKLSFLEYIELVQRKMINASNRKIITDFKGGWYPTLLKTYTTYLKRANLDSDDDFKSNGYTFENLYPFLNKYNAFFQKFVDQLLSSTIIQRKGGLLIRNTIFTKQKFTYRRGVSFDTELKYLGSDGVTYLKRPLQQEIDWTDDFICVPDIFCDDFKVSGVTINYGTTTTTTTATPYNSVMIIDTSTVDGPVGTNGYESKNTSILTFSDPIPPGYEVEVDLNFEILLTGNSGGYLRTLGEVVVDKNLNSPFYVQTEEIETNDSELFTGKTSVVIESGDVVRIRMFNYVQAGSGTVISKTTFTPTIKEVRPNGDISLITPSEVVGESEIT